MSINSTSCPMSSKQSIETIFGDMFHHDKWRFKDFAEVSVQDSVTSKTSFQSGKTRALLVPNKRLKSYHGFLRLFLLDFLPLNRDAVFSYRKGVSAYDAVAKHAKSKSFFVCDIAGFFQH